MKSQELFEYIDPLSLASFFSCSFALKKGAEIEVPDLSDLLEEEKFARVFLTWSSDGIGGKVVVKKPLETSFFPDYVKGDSVEIFIDTRDHKKSGFATRFCHHFVFLPEEVNGIQAQEMTRFRSEDTHPLCSPSDLEVFCHVEKNGYELSFSIRDSALHGYDPSLFPRIGFAFKINRLKGKPQHFPVSSKHFDLLQHPSLWASCDLL